MCTSCLQRQEWCHLHEKYPSNHTAPDQDGSEAQNLKRKSSNKVDLNFIYSYILHLLPKCWWLLLLQITPVTKTKIIFSHIFINVCLIWIFRSNAHNLFIWTQIPHKKFLQYTVIQPFPCKIICCCFGGSFSIDKETWSLYPKMMCSEHWAARVPLHLIYIWCIL